MCLLTVFKGSRGIVSGKMYRHLFPYGGSVNLSHAVENTANQKARNLLHILRYTEKILAFLTQVGYLGINVTEGEGGV